MTELFFSVASLLTLYLNMIIGKKYYYLKKMNMRYILYI